VSHPTATQLAAQTRARDRSAEATVRATLDRIAARDGATNAFTATTADRALARARAIDAAIAQGEDPGPLAGVPFAAKNLFDVAGLTTLAGSVIERDRPPASTDATAVARLEAAGAILVGVLNMDEYAYGFTTENSHYGPTRNPHDTERSAGGSSGGSGAAVAAGLVPLSLGSDTNGSIRVPASLCGVWGLKPTYGRLSRAGAFAFVPSLDHVGPFARSVADLALAYDALQGPDPRDPAQAPRPAEPVGAITPRPARVARLGGHFARGGSAMVQEAADRVAHALNAAGTVELADAAAARAAAFLITAAEGARQHLDDLRVREAEFEPLSRDRLIAGALLPAQWILHAQKIRALFRARAAALFADWDVLIAPATPTHAMPLGQAMLEVDGATVPLRPSFGVYTQPISFIGLPVIAAPVAGLALPVGVQLIAAPWREDALFAAALALERAGICASPVAPAFA
jgi:AtzE family amidohydrolase